MEGLRKSHIMVIRYMMEDAAEDQYRRLSNLADFPASFSVLYDDVSCDWIEF
jgi:hypothetical protein